MKKATVRYIVFFVVILIAAALMSSCSSRKYSVALLKDLDICFGDSPRAAASKIPGTCIEKEELASTNMTVYTYRTDILDTSATMGCYFLNDKQLLEVIIVIQSNEAEQTAALFERAREVIGETYSGEDRFVCGDIVFYDESSYSLSLGLRDGAVGIDYMLQVKDNTLYITCVDGR